MVLALTASELSQAVIIGIITGGAYSLVALGLVLVYKSSGIFNFAQGEFGSVAIYAAFAAHTFGLPVVGHLPIAVAAMVGIAAAALMGLATERFVIRPLADAPRVTLLVATAGVALLAIGVEFWRSGDEKLRLIPPLASGNLRFTVLGVTISWQRVMLLGALLLIGGLLALFFRSPHGLAILAASQEPVAAELVGVSVRRVSSLVWLLASVLGAVAAILFVGAQGQNGPFGPGVMTQQVLLAGFIAAVIGGLTSLPGAVMGGLLLGILESLGGLSTFSDIPGSRQVTIFLLLLVVLLVRPQGLLGART